jgi:hypothetical protein
VSRVGRQCFLKSPLLRTERAMLTVSPVVPRPTKKLQGTVRHGNSNMLQRPIAPQTRSSQVEIASREFRLRLAPVLESGVFDESASGSNKVPTLEKFGETRVSRNIVLITSVGRQAQAGVACGPGTLSFAARADVEVASDRPIDDRSPTVRSADRKPSSRISRGYRTLSKGSNSRRSQRR